MRRILTCARVRHSGCARRPEPSPPDRDLEPSPTATYEPPDSRAFLWKPPRNIANPCTCWNPVIDYVRCCMALHVLIADDSLSMRLLLHRVLASRGHQIYEAIDGDQALQLLHAHHPDIAILDVIMPGLDGLEVCRTARADPAFASLKVIVISANATVDDALAAGADCFLVKPFLPSRLLALIDELTAVKSV